MSPTFISLLCFGLSLGQAMEVTKGSLSKPKLQVHPTSVVVPETDVTFSCILPTNSSSQPGTFILQKEPNAEHVQSHSGEGTTACFPMYSLRCEDTGNYSCIYKTIGPYRVSEPSETLQLLVTETLPKPFISVTPSNLVDSGGNVTLRCWGTVQGVKFALYKEGEETFVGTREPTQGGVEFHLTHVSINNSGKYSCHYDLGAESKVSKSSSDVLELTVQGEKYLAQTMVSRYIGITFRYVFIFFFLFLLLACLHHQSPRLLCRSLSPVISHESIPRRYQNSSDLPPSS